MDQPVQRIELQFFEDNRIEIVGGPQEPWHMMTALLYVALHYAQHQQRKIDGVEPARILTPHGVKPS